MLDIIVIIFFIMIFVVIMSIFIYRHYNDERLMMVEQLNRNELIVALCLHDKEHIMIKSLDDILENAEHISKKFSQTKEVIKNMAYIPGEYNFRVLYSPKNDGNYSWWRFCFKVTKDREPIGYIASNLDQEMAKNLKQATRQKASDAVKNHDFMNKLSSSLQKPLNEICQCCNELTENTDISFQEKKNLSDKITRDNDQLIRQISDILLFSRIGSGRQQYHIVDINIFEFITKLTAEIDTTILNENVRLDTVYGRPDVYVEADELRLNDIVNQLFYFSSRLTTKGSIYIGWQYHFDTHMCEVFVGDSGEGITEKAQKQLFSLIDEDTQTPNEDGLSLNIIKSLTEAMGGYVTFDTQLGKGSHFSAWLKAKVINNINSTN